MLLLLTVTVVVGQPISIRESRLARPLQWVYYDHPVADSTFIGMIDPLIWGLLLLLASLWALFLQADHAEIDELVGRNSTGNSQPTE